MNIRKTSGEDGLGLYNEAMLSIENHSRASAGMRYVYPVVSRRARGVSIGINLNPNNACNWACIYCQVDDLRRGGPPPIDLGLLSREFDAFLTEVLTGDFLVRCVPEEARQLMDVAFSGNGEPTSADEFAAAVALVVAALDQRQLLPRVTIRLITNGSLVHRAAVQEGISALAVAGGEVWFKVDRSGAAATLAVNGLAADDDRVRRNLGLCAGLAPTWVQTCWFAIDGSAPDGEAEGAYCRLLTPLAGVLQGIHLYGLARPSLQPGAARLGRLTAEQLERFAQRIEKETGIRVLVSP